MRRVLISLTKCIEPIGGVLVVGGVIDYPGPYRIGVAVEHGFEHFIFILYFSRSRTVIGHFTLATVSSIIAHAKSGMGVSHPISKQLNSLFKTPFLVDFREHASHFVGVGSHEAVAMDLNVLSEIFGISIEQCIEIVVFFGILGKDALSIMGAPHFVENTSNGQGKGSWGAHDSDTCQSLCQKQNLSKYGLIGKEPST